MKVVWIGTTVCASHDEIRKLQVCVLVIGKRAQKLNRSKEAMGPTRMGRGLHSDQSVRLGLALAEHLGLRKELQRGPLETLVIDRVERHSEN